MNFEPCNKNIENKVLRNDTEMVVKEKMEYTLLGTYEIKKGLKLFSYNSSNGEITEVEIKRSTTISTALTEEGWLYWDEEMNQSTIDSKLDYFQALRLNSAKIRVKKFKEGKIKELFNLNLPSLNKIDFFKPL